MDTVEGGAEGVRPLAGADGEKAGGGGRGQWPRIRGVSVKVT